MSVLLSDYLYQQQQNYAVTPLLPEVITSISNACLLINREIRLGALDNILGCLLYTSPSPRDS